MMKKFNLQKLKTKMQSTPSPLTHTEAILKGYGIREDDIAKAFATLIRGKLSEKKKILKNPADSNHHLNF